MVSEEFTNFENAIIAWLVKSNIDFKDFGIIVAEAIFDATRYTNRDDLTDRVRKATGEKISPLPRVISHLKGGERQKDFKPAYCLYFLAVVDPEFKQANRVIEKKLFKSTPKNPRSYLSEIGTPPSPRNFILNDKTWEYILINSPIAVSDDQGKTITASTAPSKLTTTYPVSVEQIEIDKVARGTRNLQLAVALIVFSAAVLFGVLALKESIPEKEIAGRNSYLVAMDNLRDGHNEEFFDGLNHANREGSVVAASALGLAYNGGTGVRADQELAEKFAKSALDRGLASMAKAGDREAQFIYGLFLVNGLGVKKDAKAGMEYLNESYLNGHSRAPAHLATHYLNNKDEDDDCKGLELAILARKAKHLKGYLVEAKYYDRGICPDRSPKAVHPAKRAVELLEHSAKAGHLGSQAYLGWMLVQGRGVQKNQDADVIALKWLTGAANAGNAFAQTTLGWMYQNDRGVQASPKNDEIAVRWFKVAAQKGWAHAQRNIGWMYDHNRGVPPNDRNDETAVGWYRKAAEQGNAAAQNYLGIMYRDDEGLPVSDENDEIAVEWLEKSAGQGNARAQNNLGWMYETDRGVPANKNNNKIAVKWYRAAAGQGLALAQINLGRMYENGRGIPASKKNTEIAEEWYRKATAQGNLAGQNKLAWLHISRFYSETLKKNEGLAILKKGIELLKDASDKGYGESSLNLGLLLLAVSQAPEDVRKVFSLKFGDRTSPRVLGVDRFKLAWQQEDSTGAYMYAREFFLKGEFTCELDDKQIGVSKNTALDALKFALGKKNTCAMNIAGASYEKGVLHELDQDKALEMYKAAADAGNKNGSYNYARLAHRLGIENDKTTFQKITELGDQGYVPALCSSAYESMFSPDQKDLAKAGGILSKLRDHGMFDKTKTNKIMTSILEGNSEYKDKIICSPLRRDQIEFD